jgi:H+/Cl- antiporter ClcA
VAATDERPLDAAVAPRSARILAFVSVLIGGLCGGLIGWALVRIQDTDRRLHVIRHNPVGQGLGLLVGAIIGAVGVAVVAVLVLRAMQEGGNPRPDGPRRTSRS